MFARRSGAQAAPARVAPATDGLGRLPGVAVAAAAGLFVEAVAFSVARTGWQLAGPLFWLGLLIIVVPTAARLASAKAGRGERIGLVVLLMLSLYMVKILHSPLGFTFPDELTHEHNAEQTLRTHQLFNSNPILPVTPMYPGLQSAATAVASLTGLPVFGAGLLVIGAARCVLALGLFLLFERLSGSARVAGLAAAIYTANSNYLFWLSQYAYESLALPLAIMAVYMVVRRQLTPGRALYLKLTAVVLPAILAVVITHHLTSYALVAILAAASILYSVFFRKQRPGTWGLTLLAFAATAAWLTQVASQTTGYLTQILGIAARSFVRILLQEEAGRRLFQATGSGAVAPLWERAVGVGSILLLLLLLPFGLYQIWRAYRSNPFPPVLAAAALAFFAMLALRFTPKGWETSNRASEFLFVGLGFVIALGIVKYWLPRLPSPLGAANVAAFVAIVFFGGIIGGWQPNARTPGAMLVSGNAWRVEPQGIAAARWANAVLGTDQIIAAPRALAVLMLAYGEQIPLTGEKHGIRHVLQTTRLGRGELQTLRDTKVRYIVVDRRAKGWDGLTGLYFDRPGTKAQDQAAEAKWEQSEGISRLFDSGHIAIYDVGALSGVSAP